MEIQEIFQTTVDIVIEFKAQVSEIAGSGAFLDSYVERLRWGLSNASSLTTYQQGSLLEVAREILNVIADETDAATFVPLSSLKLAIVWSLIHGVECAIKKLDDDDIPFVPGPPRDFPVGTWNGAAIGPGERLRHAGQPGAGGKSRPCAKRSAADLGRDRTGSSRDCERDARSWLVGSHRGRADRRPGHGAVPRLSPVSTHGTAPLSRRPDQPVCPVRRAFRPSAASAAP
jgi:hypothetical protein